MEDERHPQPHSDSEIPLSSDDSPGGAGKYCPGVRNIDMKGRIIRGIGAFAGFVMVIIYNERWPSVLDHPVLFTLGLVFLSFLTALTFLQSFLSFCVVDGLMGRTNISGRFLKVSGDARQLDKKRALLIIGGALILGILFSAILLIKEVGSTI